MTLGEDFGPPFLTPRVKLSSILGQTMPLTPLDLLLFLLGMGFTEVMVKPLAMNLFRRTFSLLPRLFDKLDPVLPESIAKLSPEEVEKSIYSAIEGCAKEESMSLNDTQKQQLFEEFIRLYNPVIAASKN